MNSQLAYSIAEACSVARAGRTAIYEAIKNGEPLLASEVAEHSLSRTTCAGGSKAFRQSSQRHD